MATGVIINQTVDPSAGAGVVAGIGSILLRDNGGVGELWEKTGAADTAWTLLGTGGGAVDSVNGETGVVVLDAGDVGADVAGAAATAASGAASALSAHDADTTAVHGIADTANLLTTATKLDDLAAPDDNTDLNATTGVHGLLPKLGGGSTNFLRADGTWNAPAGGAGAPDTADYLVGTAQAGLSAEIVVTAAGLALLDDTTASAQRTTLGLALGHRSGRYYPCMCSAVTNSQLVTLNVLYAAPFFVPISRAYDRIGVAVPVTVVSSLIRLGIYADDAGKPGALILDAGTVSGNVGGQTDITINQTLSGLYWLAVAGQTAAPQIIHATGVSSLFGALGTTSGFSLTIVGSYSQTGITGALPDPWGATFTETFRMPIVYLRAT